MISIDEQIIMNGGEIRERHQYPVVYWTITNKNGQWRIFPIKQEAREQAKKQRRKRGRVG